MSAATNMLRAQNDDGAAVLVALPMDAQRAGALMGALAELGYTQLVDPLPGDAIELEEGQAE